jgi:hypothetical protein
VRFEAVDEAVDAKEKLRTLWQNASSIPEYAAQFKQLMARTGYSSIDLRDRFYEHLNPRMKDELVHSPRPVTTLDELIAVTTDIDTCVRQRRAKKDRERGQTGARVPEPIATARPTPVFTAAPTTDSNIMDVDATRTWEEFMRQMRDKCFGCGSTAHTKKDGNHERDLCSYCKCVGHREVVCMDKFMRKPQCQKAAATAEEGSYSDNVSDVSSTKGSTEGSEVARIAATSSQSHTAPRAILAQLLEQQQILVAQIANLREQDF